MPRRLRLACAPADLLRRLKGLPHPRLNLLETPCLRVLARAGLVALLGLASGLGAQSSQTSSTEPARQEEVAGLLLCANMEEACRVASERHLDILRLFTGDDWCPACRHLESTILSRPEWGRALRGRVVLVREPLPGYRPEGAELLAVEQRRAAMRQMNVNGVPTAVLTDEQGLPYACVSGSDVSVEAYLSRVEEALSRRIPRDAALARVQSCEGLERAAALIEALEQVPVGLRGCYSAWQDEINRLDPQNRLGHTVQRPVVRSAEELEALLTPIELDVRRLSEAASGGNAGESGDVEETGAAGESGEAGDVAARAEESCRALRALLEENPRMPAELKQRCFELVAATFAARKDEAQRREWLLRAYRVAPFTEHAEQQLRPALGLPARPSRRSIPAPSAPSVHSAHSAHSAHSDF